MAKPTEYQLKLLMINSLLQSEVEQHRLPALSVVATRNGEEIVCFSSGKTETSGSQYINGDTRFGVASITKLVTSIQLLLLCEDKRLSMDDLVATHLPAWAFATQSPVRIRHLLSHSSGLPGLASRFQALNRNDPTDQSGGTGAANRIQEAALVSSGDLLQYLNRQAIQPLAEPGQLLNYSNEGFCLAGGIIEKILGMDYVQASRQSVFKPLGMDASFIGSPDPAQGVNIALPVKRCSNGFKPAAFWDAPLFYPAGGAVSSARDLVKLFAALGKEQSCLADGVIQQLQYPHLKVPSRPDSKSAYGLGLEFQPLPNDLTLHWHSGQRTGIASFAGFIPGAELAVAVLCNIANAPVTAIAYKLIATLLNCPDITWPPTQDSFPIGSTEQPGYAGRYLNAENISVNVIPRNGKYYLSHSKDTPVHLFDFHSPDHGNVAGQTFCFLKHRKTDTQPWAIALDLRILRRQN